MGLWGRNVDKAESEHAQRVVLWDYFWSSYDLWKYANGSCYSKRSQDRMGNLQRRDYVHNNRGKEFGKKVLVDNADMVLEDAIGDYIEEISMTSPKDPLEVIRKFD